MLRSALRGLWHGWERFWFAPESTATLGLVRIAFGLVLAAWTLSIFADLTALYSEVGIAPEQPSWRTPLTLLAWWDSPTVVATLWAVLLVATLCVTVGYQTRIAAAIVFVAVLSFQQRSPDILNSGDVLLRLIGLYLVFAPAGAALSVDSWQRNRDRFWQFPARAPWALRLIQVQLSVVYLSSVFYKVQGETWIDGTALAYALNLTDLQRLPVPDFVTDQLLLMNLAAYGTLVVELGLAVLVWNRAARPWVLAAGVALHLAIDATIIVGFFGFAMFVGYLAFVPPDTAERWIEAGRRVLQGRMRTIQPTTDATRGTLGGSGGASKPDPVA